MTNPNEWRNAGGHALLLDQQIFYRDTGELDRPVIFLIHGFPTSSYDFHAIWGALHKRYRLVALDMLGFGFSDKPFNHTYSIHGQADICEALIMHLNLDRYHVLAHDYGDSVAQELLARDNQRDDGSKQWLSGCLLNGGLFPETHYARPVQKLLLSPVGWLLNKLFSKKTFDKSMTSVFGPNTPPSEQELDQFWQILTYNEGHKLAHKLMNYINDRKLHRTRWVQALANSQAPLALINGSADPVSGKHMVNRYRELVSDQMIYELAQVGHYPQVEAPDDVAKLYLAFLNDISD